jgi:predicted DNA-binding protein
VAKIDFGVDKALLKELGNLSHQLSDPVLTKIRELLEKQPNEYKDRYMIKNQVCFAEMTERTRTGGQCSLGI